MNDDENLLQNIIIKEDDHGTIDKITQKIEKQNSALEKGNQIASKSITGVGSTKGKFTLNEGKTSMKTRLAMVNAESEAKEFAEFQKKQAAKASRQAAQKQKKAAEDAAKLSATRLNMVSNSFEKLQKSLDFTNLIFKVKALSMAFNGIVNIAKTGTAIIEENNLFYNQLTNVSKEYGEVEKSATRYYERAIDYQNKLYEATHLNRVENMKSQGAFFQLFNAQGVGEELSYQLSESLSNAAIDLSSLFNIDYDEMVAKLKSGIIGNSRPLRELGIDVTEGTMQGILDSLGIDTTVEKLTFAEKEVLRYMTIVKQVGYAQGDFANTFVQSANQIRVFESELQTVGQMIGAIFNKLLANVMSVARGIIMAVEEILTALGSLIGVDWSDTGTTKPLASLGEEVDDVATGIGGATAAAKEFKKQIMSFDEIHNLTPPDKSSGGGGGGGAGGLSEILNSELTDQLEQWKSNFENIDDEAKKIKDNILKTLGFTKDINGNLQWSREAFWNNIGDWGRNIIRVIQTILAFKLAAKVITLAGNVKKLISFFQGDIIKGSGLQVGLQMLSNAAKATIDNFKTFWTDFQNGSANAHGAATKLGIQIAGFASAIGGITYTIEDIRKIIDGTVEATDMIPAIILRITQAITGAVAAISVVVKSINPIIAIVSLIVSLVTGLVASIIETNAATNTSQKEFNELKKKIDETTEARKKYNEAQEEARKSTLNEIDEGQSSMRYYENLRKELLNLVDANGKIKEGNEDRVKFILNELKKGLGVEYDLTGNIIKQYDEYIGRIDKAIQAKKNEIYVNAFQDDYTAAIKRTTEQQKKLTTAKDNYDKALNNDKIKQALSKYEELKKALSDAGYEYKETGNHAQDFHNVCKIIQDAQWDGTYEGIRLNLDKLSKAYGEVNFATQGMEDNLKSLDSAAEEYKSASNSIVEDNQLIMLYEDLLAAQISEDNGKIEAAKIKLSEFYKQQGDVNVGTIEDQLKRQLEANKTYIENRKAQGKELTDDEKKTLDLIIKQTADTLREQTKTVKTLTPEQVGAWKTLAENSSKEYTEQVNQLEPETQTLLNSLTGKVTAEQPEYWNAWSKMAVNAKEKFKDNIKSLPQDQQTTLLAGISTVKGCEQATVEAYGQLSDEGKIEYLGKIKNLPEEQRNKILEMLGEFGKQEGTAGTAARELAGTIQKAINGEELQIGDKQIKVDGKAIDDKIKGAIGTITVPIKGDYKASWHYIPKPDGSGEYEYKYFAKGGRPTKGQIFVAREAGAELVGNIGGSTGVMNNMQIVAAVAKGVSSAVASVLHSGFTVSMSQEGSVSNVQEQLVNEMRISNEYANQEIRAARPSVSSKFGFTSNGANGAGTQGLAQALAAAVEYGMNNANVNVKVEATTDTGVVIKQVSEAMNDYVNQTGQLPFAIPM